MTKRIGILNNVPFEVYPGGAEHICEFICDSLKAEGVDAVVINPNKDNRVQIDDCQALLLTNVSDFESDLLEYIMKEKPFIKMEMDYGFCASRNHLCQKCPDFKEGQTTCSKIEPIYSQLLDEAELIVFLSPFHREIYRRYFGDIVNNSALFVPFCDNPKTFKDEGKPRIPNSYLFMHRFYKEKGIEEVINIAAMNPKCFFFFLGFGNQTYVDILKNINNIVLLPYASDKKLLKHYLNTFESFFALPIWKEPGPMSLVEAELCGMKLVINNNNTVRSYNWKNREELISLIEDSREKLLKNLISLAEKD